jgi:hypothetical protein
MHIKMQFTTECIDPMWNVNEPLITSKNGRLKAFENVGKCKKLTQKLAPEPEAKSVRENAHNNH